MDYVILISAALQMLQLYRHFFTFFSITICHRTWNRIPCALQEDFAVCPFFFFFFRATPVAYGISWARVIPWDPSHLFHPRCSSHQYQIPNPPSEARDRTSILTETMSGP